MNDEAKTDTICPLPMHASFVSWTCVTAPSLWKIENWLNNNHSDRMLVGKKESNKIK